MGIRTKLVIAFAGLLLIVAVVGVVSIHTLNESSRAIQRILRENYDSVAACDNMKVALENLDRQGQNCACWKTGLTYAGKASRSCVSSIRSSEFNKAMSPFPVSRS